MLKGIVQTKITEPISFPHEGTCGYFNPGEILRDKTIDDELM